MPTAILLKLEGQEETEFNAVKENVGVNANIEVLRVLIRERYNQIRTEEKPVEKVSDTSTPYGNKPY